MRLLIASCGRVRDTAQLSSRNPALGGAARSALTMRMAAALLVLARPCIRIRTGGFQICTCQNQRSARITPMALHHASHAARSNVALLGIACSGLRPDRARGRGSGLGLRGCRHTLRCAALRWMRRVRGSAAQCSLLPGSPVRADTPRRASAAWGASLPRAPGVRCLALCHRATHASVSVRLRFACA